MGKIFVIGIGPGSRDFLTPAAEAAVDKAEVLVGGKKALSLFQSKSKQMVIDRDLNAVLEFIRENGDKDVAVLTSGDPGFYSILDVVLENFQEKDVEIIPGISSMQLCFAKLKESWKDARFISLHGRDPKGLPERIIEGKSVILTDSTYTPDRIASLLLSSGVGNRSAAVCEDLSGSEERIINSNLEDISKKSFSGNCIMVVFDGA
ncbi:MAG: precorrin-6y C5,15-methyltransferase (decarboxylating) subunit CbiE [Candidatus Hydrothermarchaeales archaeon]